MSTRKKKSFNFALLESTLDKPLYMLFLSVKHLVLKSTKWVEFFLSGILGARGSVTHVNVFFCSCMNVLELLDDSN